MIVEELCVKVIDEVKGAEDAQTHYHTDNGTSDFVSTTAAALTTPLHLTSIEIVRSADPSVEESDPLVPRRRQVLLSGNCVVVSRCPHCFSLLARRVLAIPATSASPKRLFSTSGNTMTKKRCSLSYDNLVYFYMRTGLKWTEDKKVLNMDLFILLVFVLFLDL